MGRDSVTAAVARRIARSGLPRRVTEGCRSDFSPTAACRGAGGFPSVCAVRWGYWSVRTRGSGFARWPRASDFLLREKKVTKESTPWRARPAPVGGNRPRRLRQLTSTTRAACMSPAPAQAPLCFSGRAGRADGPSVGRLRGAGVLPTPAARPAPLAPAMLGEPDGMETRRRIRSGLRAAPWRRMGRAERARSPAAKTRLRVCPSARDHGPAGTSPSIGDDERLAGASLLANGLAGRFAFHRGPAASPAFQPPAPWRPNAVRLPSRASSLPQGVAALSHPLQRPVSSRAPGPAAMYPWIADDAAASSTGIRHRERSAAIQCRHGITTNTSEHEAHRPIGCRFPLPVWRAEHRSERRIRPRSGTRQDVESAQSAHGGAVCAPRRSREAQGSLLRSALILERHDQRAGHTHRQQGDRIRRRTQRGTPARARFLWFLSFRAKERNSPAASGRNPTHVSERQDTPAAPRVPARKPRPHRHAVVGLKSDLQHVPACIDVPRDSAEGTACNARNRKPAAP